MGKAVRGGVLIFFVGLLTACQTSATTVSVQQEWSGEDLKRTTARLEIQVR